MAFRITNEWLINLPEEFKQRVEDEKLIFWKTGITVITVPFRLPKDTSKIELLSRIQGKLSESIIETYVSTKGEVVGLGYSQIQKIEGEKKRLSLITFTASDTSCLQTAFYLDDPTDLDWAKSVWEGIIFHPENTKQSDINTSK
ncbi:MAG: hypothetical protein U9R53_05660 [Chloroflexota bacterium]|nr:hypothetical protein [Chloroflexota bacterium]